jgi:hypothetical protein
VRGQVVYSDGSSLPTGGQVIFESVNVDAPFSATGFFETDGNFELTKFKGGNGVLAGDYKVAVIGNVPDDRGQMSQKEYERARNAIDRRFKSSRTSPIRFTVSAETAPHEFRVEVHPPKRR